MSRRYLMSNRQIASSLLVQKCLPVLKCCRNVLSCCELTSTSESSPMAPRRGFGKTKRRPTPSSPQRTAMALTVTDRSGDGSRQSVSVTWMIVPRYQRSLVKTYMPVMLIFRTVVGAGAPPLNKYAATHGRNSRSDFLFSWRRGVRRQNSQFLGALAGSASALGGAISGTEACAGVSAAGGAGAGTC
jgi:hypothetical protein